MYGTKESKGPQPPFKPHPDSYKCLPFPHLVGILFRSHTNQAWPNQLQTPRTPQSPIWLLAERSCVRVGSFNSTPSLFTLPSRLYTLIGNNTLPLLSSHAPTPPRSHPSNNWIACRTHRHPLSPPHLGSPRPSPGLEFVCVRERERERGREKVPQ